MRVYSHIISLEIVTSSHFTLVILFLPRAKDGKLSLSGSSNGHTATAAAAAASARSLDNDIGSYLRSDRQDMIVPCVADRLLEHSLT